jgi:hypothetical protein
MFSLHGKLPLNLIIPSEPTGESLLSSGASDGISRNAAAFLIIFMLASFALVSLFGIGMGMETRDGQMTFCPFMASKASVCQMSITEHISQWQQAFLGAPVNNKVVIFALLILIFAVISFTKPFSQIKQSEAATRFLFYLREMVNKIFNQLLIAFSDGILNPRIYEPAHI